MALGNTDIYAMIGELSSYYAYIEFELKDNEIFTKYSSGKVVKIKY